MSDDPDEEAPAADSSDSAASWSFSELLDRLDPPEEPDSTIREAENEPPTKEAPPDVSLADLAKLVRDRQSLAEWEWVTIGDRSTPPTADDTAPTNAALPELLGDASSVLLLGSPLCPAEYAACTALLGPGQNRPTNRLLVTYDQSPDDRLAACLDPLDDPAGETVVISIGDSARSTTAAVHRFEQDEITIISLTDPRNLQRLGMLISRQLSDWETADADTVLCFHSLTTLTRIVEPEPLFRFLHILQSRIRPTVTRSHFHMDDTAHDETLLNTLRPLVDITLAYGDDGELTLQQ